MRMNQEYSKINENRYLYIYNKKIKQIKTGVIISIIMVIAVVAATTINEIISNWVDLVMNQHYISYQEGSMSSDTYYLLIRQLEFNQDFSQWLSLIIISFGKILLNVGFLLMILGFLSISTDRAFNKRLRRTSLILAVSMFIFMLYLIFGILLNDAKVIIGGWYSPHIIWD